MPQSVSSNATPDLLRWARETMNMSLEFVADREKIPVLTLEEWEAGISLPTFAQLERLAKRYKRPVMVFYLAEVPKEFSVVRIKDFRGANVEFTTKAVAIIQSISEAQRWAADFEPLDASVVGNQNGEQVAAVVGKAIRKLLGVSMAEQAKQSDAESAWRWWRESAEQAGILVFTFPEVEIAELRGLAIADPRAPAVAVNAKDSAGAKIFTLLHEIAHLVMGESAYSTRSQLALQTYKIERFCDECAAEALMPMADFKKNVPPNWEYNEARALYDLRKRYSASSSAILFRLADAGFMSRSEAFEKSRNFESQQKSDKELKIPRTTIVLSQKGRRFASLALNAFYSGEIHGGQLSSLLNLKLKHLERFEKAVFSRSWVES